MSASDERYTPAKLFLALHEDFAFTLDACATPESAKCERYFCQKHDGLQQSWEGERVFCNPPYSDIAPWVAKAWRSKAELVVLLVPNWTDRAWWQDLVEPYRDSRLSHEGMLLATRFLRGRIRFGVPGDPNGEEQGRPEFGNVAMIFTREEG